VVYFNITHSLLLSSSFPPPQVSSISPTIGKMFCIYFYIYVIMLVFVVVSIFYI
jgi:hypothetical protein